MRKERKNTGHSLQIRLRHAGLAWGNLSLVATSGFSPAFGYFRLDCLLLRDQPQPSPVLCTFNTLCVVWILLVTKPVKQFYQLALLLNNKRPKTRTERRAKVLIETNMKYMLILVLCFKTCFCLFVYIWPIHFFLVKKLTRKRRIYMWIAHK